MEAVRFEVLDVGRWTLSVGRWALKRSLVASSLLSISSLSVPKKPQLLEVSGQALNRHVGTGLPTIHGGSVNRRYLCWPRGIGAPQRGVPASQEVISLFFANRTFQPLKHLQHVFPNLAFFRRRLVAKQIGRMISDHQRRAAI